MVIFRRLITLLNITLILVVSLSASQSAMAAAGPFDCSPNFYQVINGQLKSLNPLTGLYTSIGSVQTSYNAIGYNPLDNYIYGITISGGNTGHLIRIANDGSTTDLGQPAGLPAQSYIAADFDGAGNLYIRSAVQTLRKVNVAALTSTTINLTGDDTAGADLVYVNGKIYMLQDQEMTVIDLVSNVVQLVTVAGLPASGDYGAGWTDKNGNLYFSRNNDGSIYQINNFTTGSPGAALKVTGAVTSNNDGASCANAGSVFDVPVATNDSYQTLVNTTLHETTTPLLANDSGSTITVTGNTTPAHGSILVNSDGTFSYTPATDFVGTDTFNYTITDSFGRTSMATVTITVSPVITTSLLPDAGAGYSWLVYLATFVLLYSSLDLASGLLKQRHK